jgi:integrase
MASIRKRLRADGSTGYSVVYRMDGTQTSVTLPTLKACEKLRDLIGSVGARRAMQIWEIPPTKRALFPGGPETMTLAQWLAVYIETLTGAEQYTIRRYTSYTTRDINPHLGSIPVQELSRDDVSRWVNLMSRSGSSGKTVKNKHGFLSAALNEAARRGLIAANPCQGHRLPRWDRQEMAFLTAAEYATLRAAITPYWRPFVEFLVTSGCRFSEATALKPTDIDRLANTVRISKARKYDGEIGQPKTEKSRRTINVPTQVLDALDYSREWLFVNRRGNPVNIHTFHYSVWRPALLKANLDKHVRVHDLRHTCASWMIQAGVSESVVQEHLGHESIKTTTAMYRHLDRRSFEGAAAAIQGYL